MQGVKKKGHKLVSIGGSPEILSHQWVAIPYQSRQDYSDKIKTNISMNSHWEELYSRLLIELNKCKALDLPEIEIAEDCFRVACMYWEKLKLMFNERVMQIDSEEIIFFRDVKPRFTCHIEYFLILNQALIFIPENFLDKITYWEQEGSRYKRFCDRNKDFINYFEGRRQDLDSSYFLERNNRQDLLPQERLYDDSDRRSSHDSIVRSFLANKMYNDYVKAKLDVLSKTEIPGNAK